MKKNALGTMLPELEDQRNPQNKTTHTKDNDRTFTEGRDRQNTTEKKNYTPTGETFTRPFLKDFTGTTPPTNRPKQTTRA